MDYQELIKTRKLPKFIRSKIGKNSLIFFDVTRLLSRSNTSYATGIDRVVFDYCVRLLKEYPNQVKFVSHANKRIVRVPDTLFSVYLSQLARVWFGDERAVRFRDITALELLGKVSPPRAHHLMGGPTWCKPLLKAGIYCIQRVLCRFTRQHPIFGKDCPSKVNLYFDASHIGVSTAPREQFIAFCEEFAIGPRLHYLHDFIPLDEPEFCTPASVKKFKRYLENISGEDSYCIYNSVFTKNKAEEYGLFQASDVEHPRIIFPYDTASSGGTKESFFARLGARDLSNYFVYISTIEPRKNHELLLDIWVRARDTGKEVPRLLFVGKIGWVNEEFEKLLNDAIESGLVIHFSGLSDVDVDRIVRHAGALVFPSYTEGYGIPFMHAQLHNVPIIASDIAIFRELKMRDNVILCNVDDFEKSIYSHARKKLVN